MSNLLNLAPINPEGGFMTERQKATARENVNKMDLTELTRFVFENPKLDGRSKEGRSLRKFLVEENLSYETREYKKQDSIKLTHGQKKYIEENKEAKGKLTLAREIFDNPNIQNLTLEARVVSEYVDHIKGVDRSGVYAPPKSISRVVGKVNRYCNVKMEEAKLNTLDKERCEVLMNNLNTERLVRIMSELAEEDRDLFESEFVTHTFSKPDLPPEEVNLYINLCSEYVSEVSIQRQIRLLDEQLIELTEESRFSKGLADTIKTKSDEKEHCKARQEKLIQILIGKRADRIKNMYNRNKDILGIVSAFTKEDERLKAILIAERQRALVEGAIDEMETASAYLTRIVGPSKNEILN